MHGLLLTAPLLVPIAGGILVYFCRGHSRRFLRALVGSIVLLTSALTALLLIVRPARPVTLFAFTSRLVLQLRLDGLGCLFAGLVACLWPLTVLYAFRYLAKDERQHTYFAFFIMAFGVVLGIALAGNILTLYVFYELLTLATLPLVLHPMTKAAIRAGRQYLCYSLGGSAFAFIGLVFLTVYADNLEFVMGGASFSNGVSSSLMLLIYGLAFCGFGVKAALFPLHGWLPAASVAPTPTTALLHAVAVVKAGAFAIIRLTYYSFGTARLRGTWAQTAVLGLAAVTIVFGGVMALRQSHLKRRLAYSTVSNLSYILFGAALMSPEGLTAGLLHLVIHSLIKIGAFFCVGNIQQGMGASYVFEINGCAKKMPVTWACFTVCALGLTGLPSLSGFFSKWALLHAALGEGTPLAIGGAAALIVSAMLTAVYMLTIVVRAYAFPPEENAPAQTPLLGASTVNASMVIPVLLSAAATAAMAAFLQPLYSVLSRIAAGLL